MPDQPLDCAAGETEPARPLYAIRPTGLTALMEALTRAQSAFLRDAGFTGGAGELHLVPGPDGVAGAVLGLAEDRSPRAFGGLAMRLPENSVWRLEPGDFDPAGATLGFCLGAYRFSEYKAAGRAPARLVTPAAHAGALSRARAAWMVRDLINTPANDLGPAELANFAAALGERFGAGATIAAGEELEREYPAIAAVGTRFGARPARRRLPLGGKPRARRLAAPVAVRQGRVFRHRRLRSQAVGGDAAHEEGHGGRG